VSRWTASGVPTRSGAAPVGQGEVVYNVLDHGAYGNGTSNDDTVGINAAITAAATAGGGIVYLPARDFSVTQIRMKSRVRLTGAGWETRIIQRTGTSGHLVILDAPSTEMTVVSDLQLHGNKDNQTDANDALNYDNTGGSFSFYDPNHIIERVLVYIPKGNGIVLSAACRESKLTTVFVTGADATGFVLNATDSVAVGCTSGSAGRSGWVVNGANSRLIGCKSFGSGRLAVAGDMTGFRITGRRIAVQACEAQDNNEHGFIVSGLSTALITFNACIADSNGQTAAGNGFQFANSTHITANGCLAFDRNDVGSRKQRYGVSYSGTCSTMDVRVLSSANVTGDVTGTPGTPYIQTLNAVTTSG
jgi:hypothetical protein